MLKVGPKEFAERLDVGHKRNRGVKDDFKNVCLHSWMDEVALFLNWKAFEGYR